MRYDKRNETGHGSWIKVKAGDIRIRLMREERLTVVGMLDRRIMPEAAKRTLKHFNDDAKFINSVADRIRDLTKTVKAALKPWQYINVLKPPPGRKRAPIRSATACHPRGATAVAAIARWSSAPSSTLKHTVNTLSRARRSLASISRVTRSFPPPTLRERRYRGLTGHVFVCFRFEFFNPQVAASNPAPA